MGGLPSETNGRLVEKETVNVQTNKEVNIGKLIWVKLNEASWWPAQIVDENFVSSASKPSSKGSSSDVLARLYGSYIYKYVDVHSTSTEFKHMLTKNNFNYQDILKQSLEQDILSLRSSKSRKRQRSEAKAASDIVRHSPKGVMEVLKEPQCLPERNKGKQATMPSLPEDTYMASLFGKLSQVNDIQVENKEKLSQGGIEREDFKIVTADDHTGAA